MKDLITQVLGHYDLGELRTTRSVGRGFVNENWIVETTSGRYFLKRRHPDLRDPSLICAQHELVKHLHHSGFPAPAILYTCSGESLLILDGEYFEIQDYIEGVPYLDSHEAHFQAAACALGQYHDCVHGFTPHEPCHIGDLYSAPIVEENLTLLANLWVHERELELTQVLQRLVSHAVALRTHSSEHSELPCLFIHGDYHGGNLLFQGDRLVGVVDYDKACWQPRILELAEALIYFASTRPGHLKHLVYPGFLDWDKVKTFLHCYLYGSKINEKGSIPTIWPPEAAASADSLRDISLSEMEICALPDYIRCIWLSVSLKRLMEKESSPAAALEELREILDLGEWSAANRQQMIETTCAVLETETGSNPED